MAHELRIAKPTIGHDQRRGQRDTAPEECHHAAVQHTLHPAQFITAWCTRAGRVRTTDGEVHGHYQFPITYDDHQEDPINPGEHPVFLAAPPGTNEAQLLAVLFEYRVIAHPGPLPAAARSRTRVGGMAP